MKKEKNVRNRFIGLLLSLSALVLISSSGTPATNYLPEEKKESRKENAALSIDGPYILYRPDGSARVISVDKDKNVIDRTYETLPEDFSFRVTDHNGDYPFEVRLHPVSRPVWKAPRSEKVFVMSDPHGRMDCVVSLLRGNGVIDENLHWSFGGNHLVIIGDILTGAKTRPRSSGWSTSWKTRRRKQADASRSFWATMRRWFWRTTFATRRRSTRVWRRNWG